MPVPHNQREEKASITQVHTDYTVYKTVERIWEKVGDKKKKPLRLSPYGCSIDHSNNIPINHASICTGPPQPKGGKKKKTSGTQVRIAYKVKVCTRMYMERGTRREGWNQLQIPKKKDWK